MDKKLLRERYISLFNSLKEWDDFNTFLSSGLKEDFIELCESYKSDEFELLHGATRGVIDYFDDCDYIIKIPFLCYKSYQEERIKIPNYCRLEVRNYKAAEEKNLAQFFAWTDMLFEVGEIGNIMPIYIMERADVDENLNFSILEEWKTDRRKSREESEKSFSSLVGMSYSTGSEDCLIDYITEKFPKEWIKLQNFLCDNNINDLHCGNVSFCNGESIIFIDYSGYGGWAHNLDEQWFDKYGV